MSYPGLDIVERLDVISGMFLDEEIGKTVSAGAREIVRLRKIVDNLTEKLTNEATVNANLDDRLTKNEENMRVLMQRLDTFLLKGRVT